MRELSRWWASVVLPFKYKVIKDQPCRDDDILHNFSGRMYAYVYVTDGFFNRDKTAEILSAIKKYEVTIKVNSNFKLLWLIIIIKNALFSVNVNLMIPIRN